MVKDNNEKSQVKENTTTEERAEKPKQSRGRSSQAKKAAQELIDQTAVELSTLPEEPLLIVDEQPLEAVTPTEDPRVLETDSSTTELQPLVKTQATPAPTAQQQPSKQPAYQSSHNHRQQYKGRERQYNNRQ
ncbi:hypothetical protein FJ364_05820, partial [Candidatus Dependentiae bacterium]|nr:hypothetical protein [Candidatus Dependentiae bacterium]